MNNSINSLVLAVKGLAEKNVYNNSKSRKYVLRSNFLALFIIAIVPPIMPVIFSVGAYLQGFLLIGIVLNCIIVLNLNRRFAAPAGRMLQMLSLLVWLLYFSLVFGKYSSAHLLFLAFVQAPFAQFDQRQWRVSLASVSAFLLAFLAIEFQWFDVEPILAIEEQRVLHQIAIPLLFVWIAANYWYYTKSASEYEEGLRNALKAVDAKNKEVEQFVYIASHDLQEPLRSIDSFAQLALVEEGKSREEEEMYMNSILSSAKRMRAQIHALMNHGRIGNSDSYKEGIDTNQLVQEVLEDLRMSIEDSQAVIAVDALPPINGFEVELRQLFQNLISNAMKFRSESVVPAIEVSGRAMDDHWQFSVSDNGIGIEAEFRDKIFALFQRLHARSSYEGMGIGLAHCKKIVELHGGEIWFKSKPGVGSVFHFTISRKRHE